MSRSTGTVTATFYAQVEPVWGHRLGSEAESSLRGAKVIRATQTRPDRPVPGSVLLKLTVEVPAGAFYPLTPEATIVIPPSFTELAPVQVTAQDPNADAAEQ